MLIMLMLLPFLTYFMDVYQSMQLRRSMNLALAAKCPQPKKDIAELSGNSKRFEWVPSNIAIINAIMRKQPNDYSYEELGKLAGVNRQTAKSAIRKMTNARIVSKNGRNYILSQIEFEGWLKKKGKLQKLDLSKEEKERLNFLFKVMCFAPF